MKKFMLALAFLGIGLLPLSAQQPSKTAAPAPQKKEVKATKSTTEKKEVAPAKKEGAVMKKDGTPDKRYKANKHLKKDGTPDKRYKEHKETTGDKKTTK